MSTPDTQMNQYLTTIAEAVHGRDMRAAIHDGLEKTYNDSYTWFDQSLGNANEALRKATEALDIAGPMGEDIQEVKDLGEELDQKYDETNERVNNIIAHNNDTDGNSELIDLRTTFDGQTKSSAGAAVRGQISALDSRIDNLVREQSTGELEDCHAKPVYVSLYENQYPSSAFAAQTLQLSLPGSPAPSLAKYAFIKITFKDSNLFGAGIRSVYIPNPGKDAEATNIYTSDGHVTMPADGTYGISSYSRKFTAALSSNDTVLNIMFTDCEKIATDNPFAINNSDMTISDPSSTATTDNEYLIPYEVFLIDYVLDGEIEVDKDTELIDIRNGEDGTTYQSAGAAVRGQVTSAKNKTASTQSMIAPLYSVSGSYAVGDYVNYADKLYKAKQAISSEAWTPSHWQEVNVMDEVDSDVGELKSVLNNTLVRSSFAITKISKLQITSEGVLASSGSGNSKVAIIKVEKGIFDITITNRTNYCRMGYSDTLYSNTDISLENFGLIKNTGDTIVTDGSYTYLYIYFASTSELNADISVDIIAPDETLSVKRASADAQVIGDQLSELKSALTDVTYFNFGDPNPYLQHSIVLYNSGTITTQQSYTTCVTNPINVSGHSTIYYKRFKSISSSTNRGMAFYDENGDYISGQVYIHDASEVGYELTKIAVPENAVTARFTWYEPLGDFEIYDGDEYETCVRNAFPSVKQNTDNLMYNVMPINVAENIGYRDDCYIKHNTGTLKASSYYNATNPINVQNYSAIIYTSMALALSSNVNNGMAFYDENGDYISGQMSIINATTSHVELRKIVVPEGAVTARFTYFKDDSQSRTMDFAVYDAEQYEKCLNVKVEKLEKDIKYAASSLGLHTIPDNIGQLNVVKRCRQMTDIEWTPAVDLPRFMYASTTPPFSGDYDSDLAKHYIGVFKAGKTYKGVPYGRCTDYLATYGYSNTYVGHNVPIETFVLAVQNAESVIAKQSVGSVANHRSIPFALVCSAFTTYALNVDCVNTSGIPSIDGLNKITNLKVDGNYISPNTFKLGDVLNITGFHTAVITDLVRDANGDVIYIEESEATTVGEGNPDYEGGLVGGICRRVGFSVDDFFARFGDYALYRYDYIANVPYVPSKYVNVGDELNMSRLDRLPCMPYMGEGFAYKSGYIPNSTVVITCDDYAYLRVFKDGTELASSPFTVSGNVVDVEFSEVGEYEAYLCNMSEGINTSVTAKCHWSVVE